MKKVLSMLILISVMLCALCSCSEAPAGAPVTVDGVPVDREVFIYYLDRAFSEANCTDRQSRIEYATNSCIRYVATNTTFEGFGLEITPPEYAELSEETNALWNAFGSYYEKSGVSKQTYMKIRTNALYTEKIRFALFGSDGLSPIADDSLKGWFSANFVAFKLIRGYLFTTDIYGNTVEYTDEELLNIVASYQDAADKINSGNGIELVYASLADGTAKDIQQTFNTQIITDGDSYYPQDFYSEVQKIDQGRAAVCVFGDYIYLVYRVNLFSDEQLFEDKREICLKAVSEIPLQNEINTICNSFTSVRNTKSVDDIYNALLKVKSNV